MTTEEKILVNVLIAEYNSLIGFLKPGQQNHVYYPDEIVRREAKIEGIQQSLNSIMRLAITN